MELGVEKKIKKKSNRRHLYTTLETQSYNPRAAANAALLLLPCLRPGSFDFPTYITQQHRLSQSRLCNLQYHKMSPLVEEFGYWTKMVGD